MNIFGIVSHNYRYEEFDSTDSVTGDRLAEWMDGFSERIDRPTFVVLDNASIHRKGEVARKIPEWRENDSISFICLLIPRTSTSLRPSEDSLSECGSSLTITAAGAHSMKLPENFWMVSEVIISLIFLMLLNSIFLI
ncbi:MAG: hypothetical protein HDS38_09680 [Bacteroides sp.]|nr:hypothetical protein [Bacteroides sp.]MBD5263707.1 hypothetical protein [Bacteroides sp.]